jgi:hypothetical protein
MRARDQDRLAAGCRQTEALDLAAAELVPFHDLRARARFAERVARERHRVLAGADQDRLRPFGHA